MINSEMQGNTAVGSSSYGRMLFVLQDAVNVSESCPGKRSTAGIIRWERWYSLGSTLIDLFGFIYCLRAVSFSRRMDSVVFNITMLAAQFPRKKKAKKINNF